MRSAPAPDLLPIPGMNQGTAVAGGSGGSGGGDGNAGEGGDNENANGNGNGNDANGGGPGADGCGAGSGAGACPTHSAKTGRGDPVSFIDGEAYTSPERDLWLPGPINLDFRRAYNTRLRERDIGLGFGWTHTLGWTLQRQGKVLEVSGGAGTKVAFEDPQQIGQRSLARGWIIERDASGYLLDTRDDLVQVFSAADASSSHFRLTEIRGRNDARIVLRYAGDLLVEVIDSAGRTIHFRRASDGHITAIEVPDATGAVLPFARYSYDDAHNLVAAEHADGEVVRYRYDQDHLLTSYTQPSGLTFHFVYDKKHRCTQTWGDYPGGQDPALAANVPAVLADRRTRAQGILHCRFEYGSGYSEYVDSVRVQRFFYNADKQVTKAVGGGGGPTTRTYDRYGSVTSYTNPLGETSTYEYDERGRLLRETDPLGRTFLVVRDAQGRVIENVDAAGGRAKCIYDARGNAETIVDQNGAITWSKFDGLGLLREKIGPTGGRTTYDYDAHGNLIEMRLPNGAVWKWTYDYYGRPIVRTDPRGHVGRRGYTIGGKPLWVEDRIGRRTTWTYDAAGRMATSTDTAGRTTKYEYGGMNWHCGRTLPDGSQLKWRFNREGWVVEVHNENGEVHTNVYDAQGNVREEHTFDGRTIEHGHDALGRVTWKQDAAGRTTVAWNPAGELVERTYADDTADAYEYNARNEQIAARYQGTEVLLERDPTGNVVRETQIVEGERFVIESTYDLAHGRTRVGSTLGHVQEFVRDAMAGRTAVVLDGARVKIERDPFGFPTRQVLPGGAVLEDEYDAVNRLVRRRLVGERPAPAGRVAEPEWIGHRPGDALVDRGYAYGPGDDLLSSWDQEDGFTHYAYDDRGRLAGRTTERSRTEERFRHDRGNNLYVAGDDRRYAPGGRLLQRGQTRFEYDDMGRVVDRRTVSTEGSPDVVCTYEWSARGDLSAVVRPDGKRVTFTYDGFGRRVSKKLFAPDGSLQHRVRFVWDGDELLHEIRTDATGQVRSTTYAYDEKALNPYAQRDSIGAGEGAQHGAWLFYVCDVVDAPERLVTGSGETVAVLEREPWGATRIRDGWRMTTPFRFQGQYEDEETGLAYNRARYYDPETGRYLSPDPLGIIGGNNPYVYCPNPVTWTDPYGFQYQPHTCTASVQDGNDPPNTYVPPNPVYRSAADAQAGNSAGPGFYSGYASNGPNTAANGGPCWPGRTEGSANPQDWRDTYADGNMGCARNLCHTEQKALRWADQSGANLDGGNLNLGGQLPPCNNCNAAMRHWAANRNCNVHYNYPTNSGVTYHGNGNPPTQHPPWE